MSGSEADERGDVVVRRAGRGWVVGEENVSDLTSAMVLADLFAAERADGGEADGGSPDGGDPDGGGPDGCGPGLPLTGSDAAATAPPEAERLAVTVTQLEHALASRVRVEQAIGILAERHRLRPREAFDLLRKASRSRGRRVTELAHDVVESAANPLLLLPDELARKAPEPHQRSRSARRGRHAMLRPRPLSTHGPTRTRFRIMHRPCIATSEQLFHFGVVCPCGTHTWPTRRTCGAAAGNASRGTRGPRRR